MIRKIFQRLKSGEPVPELRNEIKLSRKWLDFFDVAFAEADEMERGAGAKLLSYLVDGDHEEILDWMGGQGLFLRFNGFAGFTNQGPLSGSVERGEVVDPGFWLRFSKIVETQMRAGYLQFGTTLAAAQPTDWLRTYLSLGTVGRGVRQRFPEFVTTDFIGEMLRLDGHEPEKAIRYFAERGHPAISTIGGMTEYLSHHRDALIGCLSGAKPQAIASTLKWLGRLGLDPKAFIDVLCDYACSSSKVLRETATNLIGSTESASALMLEKFSGGTAAERFQAFEFLSKQNRIPAELRMAAEEQIKTERSSKVKAAIERFLGEADQGEPAGRADSQASAPPLPEIPEDADPPPECLAALKEAFSELSEADQSQIPKYFERLGPGFEGVEGVTPFKDRVSFVHVKQLKPLIDHREFTLLHLLRFARLAGFLLEEKNWEGDTELRFGWGLNDIVEELAEARFGEGATLQLIAVHLDRVGLDSKRLGWGSLHSWHGLCSGWPADRIWDFHAINPKFLEGLFGLAPMDHGFSSWENSEIRTRAYEILSAFPAVPGKLRPALFEIALGKPKSEIRFARSVLMKEAGLEARVIEGVASRKQDQRREAANWLAELDCRDGVPALKKALAKEKSDFTKCAQLIALQKLGESIEPWVSRKAMEAEAEKLLARYSADEFLPYLHNQATIFWKGTRKPVPEAIIQWLVVRSFRAKEPESNPLLALYLEKLDPGTLPDFGLKILKTWIACGDGDMKVKGILALAAGMCDGRAVPIVEGFVREHYGYLVHQCKALIRMTGWIESPMSIQLLLSVANRFRTKSIQSEAKAVVSELAERKGWTIDELGDRTIPDAGFDTSGEMALSYGPRTLHAVLDDDLKISVRSDEGKILKSLPAPRKSDDPAVAAESKRLLSVARKELKTVLRLQKERLYESLCTQRAWKFEDWNTCLNQHPVISRYCRSLVWIAGSENEAEPGITFRPLEDKTLTNLDDSEVTFGAGTPIRLAHRCNVTGEVADGWVAHFADYEVSFLFEQFSKPYLKFGSDALKAKSYEKFRGHMVETFKLRSTATKLGYSRGQTEDGGWFYTYQKSFPTLGLVAIIGFGGSSLPEESREVALHSLGFQKEKSDSGSGMSEIRSSDCRLSELPEVLLSECVNDLQSIAATGSGFDPDWEKHEP